MAVGAACVRVCTIRVFGAHVCKLGRLVDMFLIGARAQLTRLMRLVCTLHIWCAPRMHAIFVG